ncbi:MAG: hypothetical protein DGJ47_000181 [Rickettsiaceae bacterium]
MKELLLELFSEEIPAMMQSKAGEFYLKATKELLTSHNVNFTEGNYYSGPRRIAVHVAGIDEYIEPIKIESKGPKIDAPQKALDGFCRANNVEVNQLEIKEIKGIKYYFLVTQNDKKSVIELLEEFLPQIIASYVWPKSMYWGKSSFKWVRPLHNIMCIFEGDVIEFSYGHLPSNNRTYAHRFMADNKVLTITGFTDYKNKLADSFVTIDAKDRQSLIENEILKIANINKLKPIINKKLLQEVAGLVEYPCVMVGRIADKFLSLPKEVLISSMEHHQKYFSLLDADGKLANKFIFVANNAPEDQKLIIDGNERVLSARLEDALYFYQQDLKRDLASQKEALEKVIFHAKLGSLYEKSLRLEKITKFLRPDNKSLSQAALLCKNDIISEMVGEFPNLQGIMGCYYSKSRGDGGNVAAMIQNHYKPQGSNDDCPSGDDAILALSDKMDNLVGLMLAGERASGSKDPYALRRQALGIVRLILENNLSINLLDLVDYSASLYDLKNEEVKQQILLFIEDRAKYYLKDLYPQNIVNAALDLIKNSDLNQISIKIKDLSYFLTKQDGQDLIAVYRRACNILGNEVYNFDPREDLLRSEYEEKLYYFLKENQQKIEGYIADREYKELFTLLGSMKEILFSFFDNVMVKDKDIEVANNRLSMLYMVKKTFHQIADFSKL